MYAFALAIDTLTSALVQDILSQGGQVSHYVVPPFTRKLKQLVSDLIQGRTDAQPQIEEYLANLKYWLIAVMAGYSQAPQKWWETVYSKLRPEAIEAEALPAGGLDKLFGVPEKEFWKRYKDLFSSLQLRSSDLVVDQIQALASQTAREVYETQRGKRKSARGGKE